MDKILALQLTPVTLAVCFILPFLYFGYHTKFWYLPNRLATLDALVVTASLLGGCVVLLRIAVGPKLSSLNTSIIYFLHLAVFILTILIVVQGRRRPRPVPVAMRHKEGGERDEKARLPTPDNLAVEQATWDDIIISDSLKAELLSVIELLKNPQDAHKYGIEVPKGILLQGPPGTGKTTIAKVIASTANLAFFVLRTDEIVSKYVGESEKNLSRFFQAALAHKPSVIFIDEIDSIGRKRTGSLNYAGENLLNHLLQLIDGVIKVEGIYIIGATNRAELVDSALKRPGRLNKVIEIPLPDFATRKRIFAVHLSRLNLESLVNLDILANMTEGCSGATIKAICNQAGVNAFKRESLVPKKQRTHTITEEDIMSAVEEFTVNSS